MYKITLSSSNNIIYAEKITYIYLNPNGSYSEFNKNKPNLYQPEAPEGICIKIPCVYEDENQLPVTSIKDQVYSFHTGGLNGIEEVCTIEEIDGAMLMYQMQMNIEQLNK